MEYIEVMTMTAEKRYLQDPEFHALVDLVLSFIVQKKYTPTELREAVMLAAIKYEMANARDYIFNPNSLRSPYDTER